MSLSQQTMLELMAFADGELEGSDRKRVEDLIASNETARKVVEAMMNLGEEVHEAYEEPSAVASNDIARLVMGRIEKEARPAQAANADVVDLAAARANRNKVGIIVAAALAIAAGVMLYGREERSAQLLKNPEPAPALTVPSPAVSPEPLPLAPALAAAVGAGGVDVEHVESPKHEVSVFYLPAVAAAANLNASSVVVWIGEDGEDEKKRGHK